MKSSNPSRGFYATMGEQAEAAWPVAVLVVASRTGKSEAAAAAFLDSKAGRSFALDVLAAQRDLADLRAAVDHAASAWMKKPVPRELRAREDFPGGVPFLTCWVMQAHARAGAGARRVIEQIARQHLGFETLDERKSDSLDFRDVSVWSVEAALRAAYEAGAASVSS